MKAWGKFFRRLFSEPDGTPSFSRVVSFLFLMGMLVMDLIGFWRSGEMPSWAQLLAQGLGGSAPYAFNQFGGLLKR